MRKLLVISIALSAAVLAAPITANAVTFTLDSVTGGMFAITAASFPTDTQNEGTTWTDPNSVSETRFADSFAGFGWATAESNMTYTTTATTISASASVINQAFLDSIDEVATQTESAIDILFTVPVTTQYTLNAAVTESLSNTPFLAISKVQGWNWGIGSSGFAFAANHNQVISPTGILTPAQYRLSIQVKILDSLAPSSGPLSIDSNATADFQLTLTPLVPEPSTTLLIGFGLAGLAVMRRRERLAFR